MNPQRKPIIAGNWKMNKNIPEAIELVSGLKRELRDEEEIEVVICPPYTALSEVGELLEGCCMSLGAQDLFGNRAELTRVGFQHPCSRIPVAVTSLSGIRKGGNTLEKLTKQLPEKSAAL